ncbi:SWIM zinc finger family protein [Propionivibrio dicarboxylicus]|uniref:SWIM zinc finger n=1 Tax=Propionivibrio dicarboxylicus TaxID=83767 RepID=A0A1G8EL59_9RHOO|nr:SWIM zinc finger family protein [Propionivibrio dicarboxylicus]SDH70635.1 SWIM zinc finger [Propionivibrio dicarboxylicus]
MFEIVILVAVLCLVVFLLFGKRSEPEVRTKAPLKEERVVERRSHNHSPAQTASEEDVSAKVFDLQFSFSSSGKKTVHSRTQDATYEIDLGEITCTCPDFATRSGFPKNHMSRLCKHLMASLDAAKAFSDDPWKAAIAKNHQGGPVEALMISPSKSQPVLLTVSRNKDWVNVFARKKRRGETMATASGEIDQFGWSVAESRWSYGEAPPGARELRGILKKITAN